MARPELGTKRICPVTGRKFYDLNKDPIVSPYTGQIVPIASASSTAALRSRTSAADKTSADEGEELLDPAAGDVELVSLEEADEGNEPKKAPAADEDLDGEDDVDSDDDSDDDSFLEEEDDDSDVSDLIDSDIENDEES